jgi:hypothetical protein
MGEGPLPRSPTSRRPLAKILELEKASILPVILLTSLLSANSPWLKLFIPKPLQPFIPYNLLARFDRNLQVAWYIGRTQPHPGNLGMSSDITLDELKSM